MDALESSRCRFDSCLTPPALSLRGANDKVTCQYYQGLVRHTRSLKSERESLGVWGRRLRPLPAAQTYRAQLFFVMLSAVDDGEADVHGVERTLPFVISTESERMPQRRRNSLFPCAQVRYFRRPDISAAIATLSARDKVLPATGNTTSSSIRICSL